MSDDVLLRCFNWQRERDRSWRRRLWLRDDSLAAGGVELVKRTATARVIVHSQYQHESERSVEQPASHARWIHFYERPEPHPPREPTMEQRIEVFALRPTLQILLCHGCSGSGQVPCSWCKPSTRERCTICGRTGYVTDSRCAGEGRLARWVERVYEYFYTTNQRDVWCFRKPGWRLPRAHDHWIRVHDTPVSSWDETVISAQLGYLTDGASQVAAHASELERKLLAEAREYRSEDWLYSVVTRHIVPVAHVTTRHGQRSERYVLVGFGDNVLEVPARQRLDPLKVLSWGSATTLLLAALGVGSHWVPDAEGWWTVGAGLALTGALIPGLLRILRRPPLPRTVVLLPLSGQRTGLLTCLAYLGSHARSFVVLDTDCESQLARLTGQEHSAGASESLTLRLRDGSVTRLLELSAHSSLSDEQLERVARNADSLIVVASTESGEAVTRLLVRLRRSRWATARMTALWLKRRTLTRQGEAAAALEDVLTAYRTGELSDERCTELVQRLWSSISSLADGEEQREGVTCYLY